MQAYSNPKRASDPHALPDVEVFYDDADIANGHARNFDSNGEPVQAGWYYWYCFPGCLPDSDAIGPFATREEALADAQAGAADEWSGYPDPTDPDNYWIDDVTGERVNALTGERTKA